jgi:hypothetical protein
MTLTVGALRGAGIQLKLITGPPSPRQRPSLRWRQAVFRSFRSASGEHRGAPAFAALDGCDG